MIYFYRPRLTDGRRYSPRLMRTAHSVSYLSICSRLRRWGGMLRCDATLVRLANTHSLGFLHNLACATACSLVLVLIAHNTRLSSLISQFARPNDLKVSSPVLIKAKDRPRSVSCWSIALCSEPFFLIHTPPHPPPHFLSFPYAYREQARPVKFVSPTDLLIGPIHNIRSVSPSSNAILALLLLITSSCWTLPPVLGHQ